MYSAGAEKISDNVQAIPINIRALEAGDENKRDHERGIWFMFFKTSGSLPGVKILLFNQSGPIS